MGRRGLQSRRGWLDPRRVDTRETEKLLDFRTWALCWGER